MTEEFRTIDGKRIERLSDLLKLDYGKLSQDDQRKFNALKWALKNDGLTFGIAYSIVQPNEDTAYKTQQLNGETYLGADPKITDQFGIQRLIDNPDDLLKIAACIDFLLR
jgi:hypothetical protein